MIPVNTPSVVLTPLVFWRFGHDVELYGLNSLLNDIRFDTNDEEPLNQEELEAITYPPIYTRDILW